MAPITAVTIGPTTTTTLTARSPIPKDPWDFPCILGIACHDRRALPSAIKDPEPLGDLTDGLPGGPTGGPMEVEHARRAYPELIKPAAESGPWMVPGSGVTNWRLWGHPLWGPGAPPLVPEGGLFYKPLFPPKVEGRLEGRGVGEGGAEGRVAIGAGVGILVLVVALVAGAARKSCLAKRRRR